MAKKKPESGPDPAASPMAGLLDGLEKVIRGKRRFLEDLVACLASGGHALIEDLPGTGKTTVAKALAALLSGPTGGGKRKAAHASFKRIQFTPDLLPYDITGVDVFDPESRLFEFRPGPVFANVVLADEINRTTPKVQSALLEAMAEGQVTVGGSTHALDGLFFVIATQNPVESEGTYPLPAAQLDRFMMRLSLGYPDEGAELSILRDDPGETALRALEPVCALAEVMAAREACSRVSADDRLLRAIAALCRATRAHPGIALGVSPRGGLMLLKAARARALLLGRSYLIGQDLVDMVCQTLAHRIKARDIRLDISAYLREETVAQIERSEKE